MSEVENIVIPDGWATSPLREISEKLVDGSHNPPKKQDNGLPMLSARNIENGLLNWDENYRFISEDDFELENKRTNIEADDVLLTIVGTIGRTCVVPKNVPRFTLQRSVAVIKPVEINPKFICYQLQSLRVQHYLNKNAKGTAQKGIYLKALGQMDMLVAPPEQQKRIVAKIEELFSHIDAGIDALKKAKQLLKQYRQSVFKAAVTGELTKEWRESNKDKLEPASQLLERILKERRQKWEEQQLEQFKAKGKMPKNDKWKEKYKEPKNPDLNKTHELPQEWCWATFNQIGDRVTVGHVGSMKSEYIEEGVPFLRSQNVRENRYDPKGLKFVSKGFHEKLMKSALEPGDLVTVRSGNVGVTCVIPDHLKTANCSDLVIVKQPRAVIPKFAAYFMNTITQTKVAAEKVGVALTHFNTKSMANMLLPIPPYQEQEIIVKILDRKLSEIETLDMATGEQMTKAAKSKQSILASAFSGCLISD